MDISYLYDSLLYVDYWFGYTLTFCISSVRNDDCQIVSLGRNISLWSPEIFLHFWYDLPSYFLCFLLIVILLWWVDEVDEAKLLFQMVQNVWPSNKGWKETIERRLPARRLTQSWSGPPGSPALIWPCSRSLGAIWTATLKWGDVLSSVFPAEESWQLAGAAGRTPSNRSDGAPPGRCAAAARAHQSQSHFQNPQFTSQTCKVSGKRIILGSNGWWSVFGLGSGLGSETLSPLWRPLHIFSWLFLSSLSRLCLIVCLTL